MPRFATALVLALALASGAAAQEAPAPLQPGAPVEGAVAPGSADAYTLDIDAGQFVLGRAIQHSADVVVTVSGPDGAEVGEYDATARGADAFQFVTEASGAYTFTVTPFEDAEGDYSLVLDRVEPEATTPEGIVEQVYASVDREDSPGVVFAVARRGELAHARPFGMANLTYGIPYTLETPTNIGSTSKQFTAFAIGLLDARGQLSLDDDVREHIPELPDFGQTVTLRHLITHTSGYREVFNALAMAGRDGESVQRREIIELVQRQPELQNEPGAEWNYNNTGYALLAEVVERVSGESFPDWMRENVFLPLGMENTTVRESPDALIPGRAAGYTDASGGGWDEVADLGGAMGAGAIYSTAPALARWMDNYRTATLGGRALIEAMTTPYVLASGDTTEYGFGLFVNELRGLDRLDHGGADLAHRSTFHYYPEIETGFIVLSNFPDAPSAGRRLTEAFIGEHLAPEPEDEAPEASDEDFDPATFGPETFDAYAGRYELEAAPGFVMTFRRDGERYLIEPSGQPETEVFPIAENRFESRLVDAQVTFHVEDDGSVPRLTLHQGGDYVANRLADEAEAPTLADYAGRYLSDELEAFYTVEEAEGELHLVHRRAEEPLALTHVSEDSFSGGFPIASVDFERDASGAVTGFYAGNGRTRGVWFERIETP